MKNLISYFLMLCALMGVTASCTDALENMDETVTATKGFTIYATTEDAQNQTRLGLADDGMTMLWEYGDKLVLVNKETGDSIQMPANLVEGAAPAASASFTTEEGVAPGEYWVLCNIDSKSLTCRAKSLYTKEEIKARKLFKLYASLSVGQDQKVAEIVLKNVYAKVRINLQNVKSYPGNCYYYIGMLSPHGLSAQKKLSTDGGDLGDFQDETVFFQHEFARGYNCAQFNSEQTELYSMVLPQDLTGENVYFYVSVPGQNECYEFKKAGINLEGGKSYVINLDMNNATEFRNEHKTDIETASDLRFARYYMRNEISYSLSNDIDLQGEDVFPVFESNGFGSKSTSNLYLNGNGHVLKNVKIEAPSVDYVALSTYAQNLTLENAIVQGKDYVSAIALAPSPKFGDSTNCHLTGTCSIKGNNYVGGLFGLDANMYVSNSSIEGEILVEGKNHVGGIFAQGYCSHCKVGEGVRVSGVEFVGGVVGNGNISGQQVSYTTSAATVLGQTYVGGIVGYGSAAMVKCGNIGVVTGNEDVGGICGYFSGTQVANCYNNGTVSGNSYIGGIIGWTSSQNNGMIKLCYNSGLIAASEAGSCVGGIMGYCVAYYSNNKVSISNCYSVGSISGGSKNVAGIVGQIKYGIVSNCYSSSSEENDGFKGIVGYVSSAEINNCVTSLPATGLENYPSVTQSNNHAGVEFIHSGDPENNPYMDILNSGETKFYSESTTQMWPVANYPAKCPVFVWQTDPLNGDNIFAPGFSQETEW